MPFQDDRAGNRSGLGPMVGMKQRESLSGPLSHKSNLTRSLPETASVQRQTPDPAQFPFSQPSLAGQSSPGQFKMTGQLTSGQPEQFKTTGQLTTGQLTNANITRVLTTTLPRIAENGATQTQRVPMMIKASMKRPAPAPPPLTPDVHKKHRLIMALLGAGMLVVIVLMALFSVTPLGHEIGFNSSLSGSRVITGQKPGLSNPIAQATATAVYHRKTDGYDPSFFGSQLVSNGNKSLDWPLGQCTYWANYEYHALTGYWVSWNGNADQWVTGARQAGWNVSTSPHIPSIMVMMPYTQHASGYGHVAVVEGVSGNIVHASNMNWWSNGGGWDRVSKVDFSTGPGIYFIWHS